jgi:UDP-N-acetylglucosamine 4,6-dehydratase/5-epimerase
MLDSLKDRTVLVTGGTGSFGSRFVEVALAEGRPRKVIVFSRDELKQFEMSQRVTDDRVRFFLGDVRDSERLHRAFHGVDIVIHAAALKQIPASEYNPFEAVKTNVLGAQNVITAALDCGVETVIALSTDKAANPINLYGATKLCSDKLFVAGNAYAGGEKTRFSVVRYGNVVGSRGSVVPYFLRRRVEGKLPITDPRMTRFWITLDQGVRFVMDCLGRMHGGELFVPKIPSMRVVDLAKAIAPECSLEIVGIRPGEKLHELMIGEDDARRGVDAGAYYILVPEFAWWNGKRLGNALPDGFSYRSDNNPHWLTVEDLRRLVGVAEP